MKLFLDVGNTRLKWLLLASNNFEILCARRGSVFIKDFRGTQNSIGEIVFFKQIKKNISQICQPISFIRPS